MAKVHLYRRAGESHHWQALVYVHGRRYRFSCRTTDKATARHYARRRLQELQERHNRGLSGLPDTVHMTDVFDRYEREYAPKLRPSSRRRMMDVVREARRWFTNSTLRDPRVQDVTAREVQAFLDLKRAQDVSASPPQSVQVLRSSVSAKFTNPEPFTAP